MKIVKDAENKLYVETNNGLVYLSCSDHDALKKDTKRDENIKLIKSGDSQYYKYLPGIKAF